MGSRTRPVPAPSYRLAEASWDTAGDGPGPRCAHTLTAMPATGSHGPRLILFGGATAIGGSSSLPGIRLDGVTNSVHCFDVRTKKWTRIQPAGDPPSPRAAHAAAAVGTMVVFQGGIGPAGHTTDDLYVLDLTNDKYKWHRVVVQGPGPGPRYGHAMDLVAHRYLVIVSGYDGKRCLSDEWSLDTAQKPYRWQRLNPEGNKPSARVYATASSRSDGLLLLCGGRDSSGMPQSDAYGLLMHTNGQWEWTRAPGVSPSPRYEHSAAFVGARLHVIGGALRGGRTVEGEGAIVVLDTAAGVWLDRNGIVTSSRLHRSSNDSDTSVERLSCCRHASASVGFQIYVYGGLRGDVLLDDLIIAEDTSFHSGFTSISMENHDLDQSDSESSSMPPSANKRQGAANCSSVSMDQKSVERLAEASAAEAEAATAIWQAVKEVSAVHTEGVLNENNSVSNVNDKISVSESSDNNCTDGLEPDVRLHPRAVVVAKEAVGNLAGLVRQLSLDHFENEGRRMYPSNSDPGYPTKFLNKQKSPQGLHKKIISSLLEPRNWKAPAKRSFFLDCCEVGELCHAAEQIFKQEPTVLQLKAPVKVFGDLHGQFGDLMRLFDVYGFPSTAGDITACLFTSNSATRHDIRRNRAIRSSLEFDHM